MEFLDKENQLIAVEKVLEEMQKAEECVKSWNASWQVQLLNAHCLPLHYEVGEADVRKMEINYGSRYKLANAFHSADSIGIPLAKKILVGNNTLTGKKCIKFEVEFGRIDWCHMKSRKSIRHFSFYNDGTIKFNKDSKPKATLKHTREFCYNTSFNVLSNDFDISIILFQLTSEMKYKFDCLSLSLNGNIVIEKYNDIEIIKDLSTGMRLVKIEKRYDERNKQNNASITFEAALNPDNSLEYGAVAIQKHKRNGKVNGTYRFDVSRKKGIRANFYSRKGIKVDLTSNPVLLDTANTLLPEKDSNNSDDIIISDFANSTQEAIARNLNENVLSLTNYFFNIELVNQIEKKIIEMVKCIRGELPLPGLIDRIDNCLEMIDKKNNIQINKRTKYKTLKI